MNKLSAKTGWEWIRSGFFIFKKRPFFLVNLLFLYMMIAIFIGMIPYIGQVAPVFTMAVFTYLFMSATLMIDRNDQVSFGALFSLLNRRTFLRLLALSGCYLLFGLIVAGLSILLEGGPLFAIIIARDGSTLSDEQMIKAGYMMLVILALYVPFFMLTWFAAPLIGWRQMSVPKAMFFSFFSVAHAWRSFLIYVLSFFMIGFGIPSVIGAIIGPLLGGFVGTFVIYLMSVIVTTALYCSFYPTSRDIFGIPILNH